MSMSSEEYFHLKEALLSRRKHMVGVRSDDHFLVLRQEIREVLEEALGSLSFNQLSEITGFSKSTLERWSTERLAVDKLRQRIKTCRALPGRRVATHLRPDICALARLVPARVMTREFGISRGAIYHWLKAGWDKVDVSAEADVLEEKLEETSPCEADGDGLTTTPEVRQLEIYLERHKGKVRKKYSLAEKKLMLALAERFGSKAVRDHFGVSYDTIARLKRRQENEIERQKRIPMRYIPVIDIMRKHPGMGPMQIRDYIRRHLGLSMGVNSIRKVMEQQGWVPPFVKTTHVKDGLNFYEAARKNYLWHMDFKHQWVNKCKVFILFIQDDYSRFIAGHTIADGEKIDIVLACVEESIRIHGKPESIMSDGGSAFFSWRGCSRFTRFLEDYGIEQLVAQTPNINGKLENLNGQVEKELLLTTSFASVDHFKGELAKWVGFYNFSRPHQGLNHNQVPADRYFPGAGRWYGETREVTRQQSLIAETMATLLGELKKPK